MAAAVLLLLGAILPGFEVSSAGAAIGFAAVAGLFNAVAPPGGIAARRADARDRRACAQRVRDALGGGRAPGVELDGLGSAVVLCVVLAAVVTGWSALLALDDDARVLRPALRRARRAGPRDTAALPGVLFLEIDGLAISVLRRAVHDGNAPARASRLHEGTHRLHGWETDWSSQTGACQAGILHGNNEDMPAFRWWEKDRGAAIVTMHPRDAAELERRVSDGRGLLHADVASRANILSGDAPHSLLTMSTMFDRSRPGRIGQDYFTYFSRPLNASRTFVRAIGSDEARGRLDAALTEAAAGDGAGADDVRTATRGRTVDGEVSVDGRARGLRSTRGEGTRGAQRTSRCHPLGAVPSPTTAAAKEPRVHPPDATNERGSVFDLAGYWLTVAGVYLLVGVLFLYSGKSKLFDDDGHAPAPLKKQFEGTFIDKVPGVDAAWLIIGILEFGIFLLMLLSIVRGEFLPHRKKSLLLVALALALLNFACLSFGQTSTGNDAGTASLYSYFAATAVILLLVLKLPPNGPADRLDARPRMRDESPTRR